MANGYKDTMNLPRTDFAMRANLPENEPKRLEKWERERIYERVLEKNRDGRPHILHDGPPYANGPIHIGHAFNKILKDFVNKSHAQQGFFTPYVPGWDCHGQPIEHMVEKTLGPKKMAETDQPTLRRLCREWAEKYVGVQREGFKRLGVNADWEHPYLTFTPDYEAGNVEVFKKMYLDGSVYRGRKPIHWCKRCHTALAEAEIEYGDETSPSIYVKFKLDAMPGVFEAAGAAGDAYVLIWTTTPWTLPANTAVSLAPDADYAMVQADGSNLVMARDLAEQVAEVAGWESWAFACGPDGEPVTLKGRELTGLSYTCPVRHDLKGTLVYGDHVTLDTGTGCVHTAPGHGQEDYLVGIEFDLPLLMPVDDNGRFTDEAGQFAGLDTDEANPVIIDWLREQGTLVAERKITHSYPHCWRCHEPVIFRATDQWFVSMEANSLRERALSAIEDEVEWVPAWASRRIGSMVADRPDWCISRQRSWGVPIPVFKCAKCGSTVATEETFDAVIELFRREGADAWFTRKPSEYLPRGTKCDKCGGMDLVPEKDILDVWWESGVSNTSVLKHRADEGLRFPADLYLEGSDQHRGWFQSSLLTSMGAYGVPPYKAVMHCGFTVDEEGRKMSKSLGNGVDPAEVMEKYGADVLRLWVASVDYSRDVSISDGILKQVSDAYRRFRNTFRFLLGSLDDFGNADFVGAWDDLEPIDRHVMAKAALLHSEIARAYASYRFNRGLPGVLRLRERPFERLHGRGEGPPVLRGAGKPAPPRRAERARQRAGGAGAGAGPRALVHHRRGVECYPAGMRAEGRPDNVQLAGWPRRADFLPALPEDVEAEAARFEPALAARETATKALEDARAGARSFPRARRRRWCCTPRRRTSRGWRSSAPTCWPSCSSFPVWSFLPKGRARSFPPRCCRPTARSARVAGTTASWAATRGMPTCANAAATCSTPSAFRARKPEGGLPWTDGTT